MKNRLVVARDRKGTWKKKNTNKQYELILL